MTIEQKIPQAVPVAQGQVTTGITAINNRFDRVESAAFGFVAYPVNSTTMTMSSAVFWEGAYIEATVGSPAPGGAVTIDVPAEERGLFSILNNCGEDISVQISGQSETPPTIADGSLGTLVSDGVNVRSAGGGGGGGGAPATVDYLVKTASGSLSAERVITDSATIIADWSTAGQVRFDVVGGGSSTEPTDFKDSVAVATTANITLSGEQTIDGVLTSANRVLVKDQTTGSQNGIYVSAAGAWSRADDADVDPDITAGMLVYVENGTANGDQVFTCTNNGTITIGTTALVFQAIATPQQVFVGKNVNGTSYTHVLNDGGKRLEFTNAAAKTFTVAPQSSVNSAVNTTIKLFNVGAGLLTVAPGSGVTINSYRSVLTLRQYEEAWLEKRANPNTWVLSGVGYDDFKLIVACSDETTALTTGTAKITFRLPHAVTLTAVRASLTTAQTSGSIFTVDINEGGTSVLSTKLTIDNTEKTSTTAATAAVISDSALADDAEITIDIDQIGDGTAKGLKITLIGTRT
jgi:hypothetical protein